MRYDDAKIESSRIKNWNSSGNESLGFESFNRDDICMFANSVDTSWGWAPQSAGSSTYIDNIATLNSSISTLSCNATSMSNEINNLNKQLKMIAAKMGVSLDVGADDRLNLKNQFRDGRLRRCQLQTL